jgi:hypothetical protein
MSIRRTLVTALLVSVLTACAHAAQAPVASPQNAAALTPPIAFDPSTELTFTESAARLFRAQSSRVHVTVLEQPLTLKLDVDGTNKHDLGISLDRMWVGCRTNPAGCEGEVRDFVAKVVNTVTLTEKPITAAQVVAVLRSRGYLEAAGGVSSPRIVVEPFVDDLYVVYMVDLPDAIRTLQPEDLVSLKVARSDLAPLARANLEARLGHIEDALRAPRQGDVAVFQTGSLFESSLLFLFDQWQALSAKVGQPIVVAVPSADTMILTIAPNREQIGKLRELMTSMYRDAERPVSERLFQWQGDGWAPVP